jgi:ACS family D-galactonate transporter-like MFS transporter
MEMKVSKAEPGAWVVVALLFLFMLINFVDKAVVGLAGVPIMKEMNLTPAQFGLIGSSFFFLFSISAILTGFLVNRVKTRWALLVMGLVWALTQFPMVGTVGFATMMACRIALGAGEGPAYPVALHSAYKFFPNELRTLPTAVIAQGASIGVMAALPALNYVIINYSWHWAFGMLGIAGLAWTVAWLILGKEGSLDDVSVAPVAGTRARAVPYSKLLFNPTVLAAWCAFFGAYWALSLALSWQTPFLINGLGFSQHEAGFLAALPWGLSVITVIAAGWLSQRMLLSGFSSRVARGVLGGACVALGGIGLIIMPQLPGAELKVAMSVIAGSLPGVIYVVVHAVVSEITPAAQRGAMLAIGNAVGTSGGLLAPFIMGSIIENAATPIDGYSRGFVLCGIIMAVTGAIGMAFMRPERDRGHLDEARLFAPDVPAAGEPARDVAPKPAA